MYAYVCINRYKYTCAAIGPTASPGAAKLFMYFTHIMTVNAAGVLFILRPKRFGRFDDSANENNKISDGSFNQQSEQTYNSATVSDDDYLRINSVFSGVNRTIVSKDFKGGKVSCVFGGTDIDLTQADIRGEAVLKFEVIFGGVDLIVPPHFIVINEIDVKKKKKIKRQNAEPSKGFSVVYY